jgi:hypothetical protein
LKIKQKNDFTIMMSNDFLDLSCEVRCFEIFEMLLMMGYHINESTYKFTCMRKNIQIISMVLKIAPDSSL